MKRRSGFFMLIGIISLVVSLAALCFVKQSVNAANVDEVTMEVGQTEWFTTNQGVYPGYLGTEATSTDSNVLSVIKTGDYTCRVQANSPGTAYLSLSVTTYENTNYNVNTNTTRWKITVVDANYVRYNANGGSGAPSAQKKTKGKTLTLSTGRPVRDGFEFLGWSTSSGSNKVDYLPGGSYTLERSITLYAVWKNKATGATETKAYNGIANPRIVSIKNEEGQDDLKSTWDCVYFGNYPQDDVTGNVKTPIKWRVLSVDEDGLTLLSDKILDGREYHTEGQPNSITWAVSYIKKWLNNDFEGNAFTKQEINDILSTYVVNDDNPEYGTSGGSNGFCDVYLLSISEASNPNYGFPSAYLTKSKTRMTEMTPYAKKKGARSSWYLRSPGKYSYDAAVINIHGILTSPGAMVIFTYGIRPVIRIKRSSSYWTYAGTVCSDGSFTCENHTWDSGKITIKATTKNPGQKTYTCKVCGTTRNEIIPKLTKKENPMKVKISKKIYRKKQLKKGKKSFKIKVTKAKGKLSFIRNKAAKKAKIKVTKKGKVTIPKNCKAGVYKITVKAAGDKNYDVGKKIITITVK